MSPASYPVQWIGLLFQRLWEIGGPFFPSTAGICRPCPSWDIALRHYELGIVNLRWLKNFGVQSLTSAWVCPIPCNRRYINNFRDVGLQPNDHHPWKPGNRTDFNSITQKGPQKARLFGKKHQNHSPPMLRSNHVLTFSNAGCPCRAELPSHPSQFRTETSAPVRRPPGEAGRKSMRGEAIEARAWRFIVVRSLLEVPWKRVAYFW